MRGGAATLFYPFWHLEAESLLVLKNNKGVEDNRIRHLDYGVQFNKLMYQRLIEGGNITLFSPNVVEGLYEAFFADQEKFERLYTEAEGNPNIKQKSVSAVELFSSFAQERAGTGRIYLQNVDHCNTNSPFDAKVAPIKQSNLCVAPETTIATKQGSRTISTLEGQEVDIYNGLEYTPALVAKTASDQKLLKITVDRWSGESLARSSLECTHQHRWYLADGTIVRTVDLKEGDLLEPYLASCGTKVVSSMVISIEDEGRVSDTYCVREPKRSRAVFNGILTGQCLEIALPTKPLNNVNDEEGEVALCTLSALNLGEIDSDEEMSEVIELGVRALDELLDYQNYPLPAAKRSSMGRRTLGLGVINYSYWLAKQGFKYSDGSANNATHELFEKIQYYSLVASNKLAQEKGACPYFNETTYSQGIMPMDRCKVKVDELHSAELLMDWDTLRSDIKLHGLRNSTLTALMPSETSSQVSNATNGIETPRGLVSVKTSKDGVLKQVVPDLKKLRKKYELLWDIPDNEGYLQLVGIMQKWVDQAISANTNYDPNKFEGGKVPMQIILQDLIKAYSYGAKTLYYHNTRDGSSESSNDEVIEVEDEDCAGGACKI